MHTGHGTLEKGSRESGKSPYCALSIAKRLSSAPGGFELLHGIRGPLPSLRPPAQIGGGRAQLRVQIFMARAGVLGQDLLVECDHRVHGWLDAGDLPHVPRYLVRV